TGLQIAGVVNNLCEKFQMVQGARQRVAFRKPWNEFGRKIRFCRAHCKAGLVEDRAIAIDFPFDAIDGVEEKPFDSEHVWNSVDAYAFAILGLDLTDVARGAVHPQAREIGVGGTPQRDSDGKFIRIQLRCSIWDEAVAGQILVTEKRKR